MSTCAVSDRNNSSKKRALDGNLERILEKVVRIKLYCFLIRTCWECSKLQLNSIAFYEARRIKFTQKNNMGQTVLSHDTNLSKTFQGVTKRFLRNLIENTWESNIVPMLLYPDRELLKMFANAKQVKPFLIKND